MHLIVWVRTSHGTQLHDTGGLSWEFLKVEEGNSSVEGHNHLQVSLLKCLQLLLVSPEPQLVCQPENMYVRSACALLVCTNWVSSQDGGWVS